MSISGSGCSGNVIAKLFVAGRLVPVPEAQMTGGMYCCPYTSPTTDTRLNRINWIGTAVNQFYASVRKALIVVLVLRAIGILIALGISGWWVFLH